MKIGGNPIRVVSEDEVTPDVMVLCTRVADRPVPYVPSNQYPCTFCGEPVWASIASSVQFIERGNLPACLQCAIALESQPEARA